MKFLNIVSFNNMGFVLLKNNLCSLDIFLNKPEISYQMMLPYYKTILENGLLDKEEIKKVINVFYNKINPKNKIVIQALEFHSINAMKTFYDKDSFFVLIRRNPMSFNGAFIPYNTAPQQSKQFIMMIQQYYKKVSQLFNDIDKERQEEILFKDLVHNPNMVCEIIVNMLGEKWIDQKEFKRNVVNEKRIQELVFLNKKNVFSKLTRYDKGKSLKEKQK